MIAVSLRPVNAGFQSTLPTRGSDQNGTNMIVMQSAFQSTLPTRGSDDDGLICDFLLLFQSTLPTRGSDMKDWKAAVRTWISIHAPHEGERHQVLADLEAEGYISIHAPHEGERRLYTSYQLSAYRSFQSTLPTRGSDGGKVHLYAAFPRIY